MKTIHDWIIFIFAIAGWEIARSEWVRDKLSYLFFVCLGLSFAPVLGGLTIIALLFLVLHQVLAAAILGGLVLIGLVFRLTNGFGVSF